jgi:hypothetical protein
MRKRGLTVLAAALLAFAGAARAQDVQDLDPLLKILVDNKVITVDQAQAVQQQYDKQKPVTKDEARDVAKEEVAKSAFKMPSALEGLKVGSEVFFSFQNGDGWSGTKDETTSYNRFVLKRGYINIEKEITPWLSARVTPDIYADSTGQYVFRMKYAYAYFHWKGNKFFNNPYLETGVAHTPWIDYEDQINRYRMVEPNFLDRNSLVSSADLGIMTGSNFGPELSATYKKDVQDKYAGTYGSWALGLYNGGGYATSEKNQNKAVEWRLSIRPFGAVFPGLQVQWTGVRGFGNKADDVTKDPIVPAPDWNLNQYGLTYESKWFNAYYLYYTGDGNAAGTLLDTTSHATIVPAAPMNGYTWFVEGKFPANRKWSAFVRYDRLDNNTNESRNDKKDIQTRTDIGIAWWFFKANALVLDYQVIDHTKPWPSQPGDGHSAIPDDHRWQLTYRLKF